MKRRPTLPANLPPVELLDPPATVELLAQWRVLRQRWQDAHGWPACRGYPAGTAGRLQADVDARLVLHGAAPFDRKAGPGGPIAWDRDLACELLPNVDDDPRAGR